MDDFRYVWMIWASAFLVPWALLYLKHAPLRREMLAVSAATSLLGLTEPIFVPEYWNPPSLFDLAARTGFDIESLVFCFAIGGIGFVAYKALARLRVSALPHAERHGRLHRFHRLALAVPFVSFVPLYLLPWNPIYPGIAALGIGGAATVWCRPDLARASLTGGALFLGLYAAFMALLLFAAPGYVEQVWNLADLSGVVPAGIPVEELAFGFAFGLYWAGVYEHFTWRRTQARVADSLEVDPTARRTGHS